MLGQQPDGAGQGGGASASGKAAADNRQERRTPTSHGSSTDELFNVATSVAPSDPEAEAFADLEAELAAAAKDKVLEKKDHNAMGAAATDDLLSAATAMTSEGGVECELEGEISATVADYEKKASKEPDQAAGRIGRC